MMFEIGSYFKTIINAKQIKALLWKDFLVRIRQPWMTALQYLWPCIIFIALYTLRFRYHVQVVDDCQFATRQLPGKYDTLPFFQSYICTLGNECLNATQYEETSKFENGPLTPVLNIVQTFMNEPILLNAIVNLPENMDFLGTITTIYSHNKFKYLEENVNTIKEKLPMFSKLVGRNFDIKRLWSDSRTFSSVGSIICGKPFPIHDDIRFVQNIFYQPDDSFNQDEVDAMPTQYCKQLYRDITRSSRGKMTWSQIKPVIYGKIIYGPSNVLTDEIMLRANDTFDGINKLQVFIGGLHKIIVMLKTNEDFQGKFKSLLQLAKSPFVQSLLGGSVDINAIQLIFESLLSDDKIAVVVETIHNILECFSIDRFVSVPSEIELEKLAYQLNEKKMFYSAIYFNNVSKVSDKEYSYKIRMDVDNIPITLENRNRFWFPGPNANFGLEMKYHRGFIQIQNTIDRAIIKTIRHHENLRLSKERAEMTTIMADYEYSSENSSDTNKSKSVGSSTEAAPSLLSVDKILSSIERNVNISTADIQTFEGDGLEDFLNFKDEGTIHDGEPRIRKKRAPQLDILDMIFGNSGDSTKDKNDDEETFHIDEFEIFTKQFPYPKYKKDEYVTGIYLAQAIQMAFFFALVVQVAASIRQLIWMKESGNSTLMRVMGLRKSSEHISWIITNILELLLIFALCVAVLYIAEIITVTTVIFLYFFLLVFGVCLISFCYMLSTFFSTATIGAVSGVFIFFAAFFPYIIVVAHDAQLSYGSKFLANLSISTAFCYAWRHIMRFELQQKELSFHNAFDGPMSTNDLKFGMFMLIFDTVLYAIIGYLYERFAYCDFIFYAVPVKDMDSSIGAFMRNVTKTYGEVKAAVNNVSIVFHRDYVTCLLGRNGAGKSTIIKLLTGQIKKTSGEIYLPQNVDRISGNESKERVGLCPQNNVLIPNLTAKEHLELYANIKMQDRYSTGVKETMESLDFGKHAHFKSEDLSGGFKRRLNIAIAFIGSPNLVILDEPCSGVDTKARKNIWELISVLRKGRAVILATHYLDEAEHLSDNVLIMNDGEVICENNSETLQNQLTKSFDLQIKLTINSENHKIIEEIKRNLNEHVPTHNISLLTSQDFNINIPYYDVNNDYVNFSPLIKIIESLQQQQKISHFRIVNKNLESIFDSLNCKSELEPSIPNGKGNGVIRDDEKSVQPKPKYSEFDVVKNLLWKRFVHFKRNYRMLLLVLALPAIFETLAMTCMIFRPPGEFDKELRLSSKLYAHSMEFYTYQNMNYFDNKTRAHLKCTDKCEYFSSSERAFRWILDTHDDFIERRYGGITLNDTTLAVWYNNKGYHSMPVYLNELDSALFKSEMDNDQYKITTFNHPLKLGIVDLSMSSILQQVADGGIAIVLVISFSLVVAASSIYIVNERISGEKLQQKLCNVSFRTYWGVAFLWDFTLYCIALLIAFGIFQIFQIPIYTGKDNLYGICVLIFMFGFAMIPMVHLVEKLFQDASLANMYILCMNIIIALSTVTVILLIDVLGDSDETEWVRNFLNKLFLIFPQHAFTDGLLEICKNHIIADILERYYIHIYKSPIASTLLLPHILSLFIYGLVFMVLNYLIESGYIHLWMYQFQRKKLERTDLDSIVTSDINKKYDLCTQDNVLRVDNLCKTYKENHSALDNVSFNISSGECFGLLGANGAGKSTIFSILSGQIYQSAGSIKFFDKSGISYCPQTNALDSLLTVQEVIQFYGRLRKISDITSLTTKTLRFFHLEQYKHISVKNLSGGNRRKLSVAVTCFGDTRLVLMDEPTSDMDPVTRSLVYNAINELIAAKRSVILTSHTISEIERVCHRIGVMRDGKMLSMGPPIALKQLYGQSYIVTIYYDHIESLTIEGYLKKHLEGLENLIIHNNCLQFSIKIKSSQCDNENNVVMQNKNRILLSDLFNKLYLFTLERRVVYTVSECLLDKVFHQVLESDYQQSDYHQSYSNPAFSIAETNSQ